jgi:hypothetical protein
MRTRTTVYPIHQTNPRSRTEGGDDRRGSSSVCGQDSCDRLIAITLAEYERGSGRCPPVRGAARSRDRRRGARDPGYGQVRRRRQARGHARAGRLGGGPEVLGGRLVDVQLEPVPPHTVTPSVSQGVDQVGAPAGAGSGVRTDAPASGGLCAWPPSNTSTQSLPRPAFALTRIVRAEARVTHAGY